MFSPKASSPKATSPSRAQALKSAIKGVFKSSSQKSPADSSDITEEKRLSIEKKQRENTLRRRMEAKKKSTTDLLFANQKRPPPKPANKSKREQPDPNLLNTSIAEIAGIEGSAPKKPSFADDAEAALAAAMTNKKPGVALTTDHTPSPAPTDDATPKTNLWDFSTNPAGQVNPDHIERYRDQLAEHERKKKGKAERNREAVYRANGGLRSADRPGMINLGGLWVPDKNCSKTYMIAPPSNPALDKAQKDKASKTSMPQVSTTSAAGRTQTRTGLSSSAAPAALTCGINAIRPPRKNDKRQVGTSPAAQMTAAGSKKRAATPEFDNDVETVPAMKASKSAAAPRTDGPNTITIHNPAAPKATSTTESHSLNELFGESDDEPDSTTGKPATAAVTSEAPAATKASKKRSSPPEGDSDGDFMPDTEAPRPKKRARKQTIVPDNKKDGSRLGALHANAAPTPTNKARTTRSTRAATRSTRAAGATFSPAPAPAANINTKEHSSPEADNSLGDDDELSVPEAPAKRLPGQKKGVAIPKLSTDQLKEKRRREQAIKNRKNEMTDKEHQKKLCK